MSNFRRYIVTGCGRSGTGFLSGILAGVGVKCSHEKFFSAKGQLQDLRSMGDGECEASWYAAPYLKNMAGLKVVHLVRDPLLVANSFYRLGLFSKWGWRNMLVNPSLSYLARRVVMSPAFFYARAIHAYHHQVFLHQHGGFMRRTGEVARCVWYWHDWNLLVEDRCKEEGIPYIRVALEDLIEGNEEVWDALRGFLGVGVLEGRNKERKNEKSRYPRRSVQIGPKDVPDEVASLAARYGYLNYLR